MLWLQSSRNSRRKSLPRWLRRPPCRKCALLLWWSEDNSPGSRPGWERVRRRDPPKRRMRDRATPDGSSGPLPKKRTVGRKEQLAAHHKVAKRGQLPQANVTNDNDSY